MLKLHSFIASGIIGVLLVSLAIDRYQTSMVSSPEAIEELITKANLIRYMDFDQAVDLAEQAADIGGAKETYFLAELYREKGIEMGFTAEEIASYKKNLFDLFYESALQGYAPAMLRVARFYDTGYSIDRSYAKTMEWYTKGIAALNIGIEQGDPEAHYQFGMLHLTGRHGTEKNPSKAASLFGYSAERGHADALYQLAEMWEEGVHTSADLTKAVEYYEKAAAQGSFHAIATLGELYADKGNKFYDITRAAYWYEEGAKRGAHEFLNGLAEIYDDNDMHIYYQEDALKWYLLANTLNRVNNHWNEAFAKLILVVPSVTYIKQSQKAEEWVRKYVPVDIDISAVSQHARKGLTDIAEHVERGVFTDTEGQKVAYLSYPSYKYERTGPESLGPVPNKDAWLTFNCKKGSGFDSEGRPSIEAKLVGPGMYMEDGIAKISYKRDKNEPVSREWEVRDSELVSLDRGDMLWEMIDEISTIEFTVRDVFKVRTHEFWTFGFRSDIVGLMDNCHRAMM